MAIAKRYGTALLVLAVITIVRVMLTPVIGNRSSYGFFLIGVWLSGRYGGFGPSVFALVLGGLIAVVVRSSGEASEWTSLESQVSFGLYLALGAAVAYLSRSEQFSRASLIEQRAEHKVLEEVNRTNALRFQAIMDNALAVIYVKDLQGRFLMVNNRFEELSTHGPVVGKTDVDLFPPEVVAQIHANDQKVRDTRRPLEFEEIVPQSDGPHTYVAVKFPIFDERGQVTAIGGISTDISERKRALDALEAEQELLRHIIEAQDQERQLIAYEIHDGLIQYLTGALMQLEAMHADDRPVPKQEAIESILGVLRKAVAEGRRLMDGIRTPVLDGFGVVAAIENLIEEEERAHVKVEFVKDNMLDRMDPRIEEAVYRITQEALTNIGKHSQSKRVRIALGRTDDRVHLEVRDWGVGFTPTNRVNGAVHGLRGMVERARIAGGKCTIESTPGEGTSVIVDLPYVGRNMAAS